MTGTKALIVDGHSVMRFGLRAFLEGEGVKVIGQCATGEEALTVAHELCPDVIVLGLNPTGATDGVEACRRLKGLSGPPYVMVHTAYNYAEDVSSCFVAGADSYLHKSADLEIFLDVLNRTLQGERVWLPGEKVGEPRSRLDKTPMAETLTAREREVLAFMLRRYSNAEISSNLFMGQQTVKNHVSSILRKFGVRSRKELLSGATSSD